ncbi:hypothetical protein FisN_39Lh023 [Fistulifera solaris]|uniref:Major facilitator superfamily (MFS) profile domain-containing protein n=1 Tax=Fistulifera solaris TaxID=1519565 RepID=A0A1Z5K7J9_FISSO|nr:hypothetical protein FisN_39Lh023 [Fistulifera solaris]|eukprot:GAX22155.1 hypothetical protein FisN_39Lh023 [Fistulifera solaris]
MKLNNEYAKVKNLESPGRHPLFAQHDESMQKISQTLGKESLATSSQYSSLEPRLSGPSRVPSSMDKARALALFSVCTILLFADQNLMSPNLTAIAKEFNFDDEQRDKKLGGEIALAFFVLGAPASYLVGCLGDAYNRTKLFAVTVCIGELGCILTYWVQTYSQLYLCRAVTGFSVGGALPLIYSILGDLFPSDERHRVGALVGIGTGAGISLGQCIAGFLGPTFGWRLPFLVIGLPAVFCALAVWLFVPDPERGAMEEAMRQRNRNNESEEDQDVESCSPFVEMVSLEERVDQYTQDGDKLAILSNDPELNWMGFWATFVSIVSTPTVRLALLQGGPGCVPWGIVNMYLNDFLSENRGMTVEVATLTVLFFGLGNFVGMLMGGFGATYLYRIDPRYPPLLAGSAAILGCFPFWMLLNWIDNNTLFLWTALVAWFAGGASGVTGPIIKAQLQNVTLPQERGQAFALFNTTDDFGRGLGPVFVAAMISRLGGRTNAFNIGVFGWVICGIINLGVYFTIQEDEARVQAKIVASLSFKKEETGLDVDSSPSPAWTGSHTESLGTTLRKRSFEQGRDSSSSSSNYHD